MALPRPILLVGCGKMGTALLQGWLARGAPPAAITVVEPRPSEDLAAPGLAVVDRAAVLPPDMAPAVVVFAVKPQLLDDLVAPYARFAEAVFLSIAAGKPIRAFEQRLGANAAIVRAMPNTPAAIGRGITVLTPNGRVTAAQRQACERLMAAAGETVWLEREELMDAVTALSGSGPAYVFLLAEALAEAGEAAGLPPDVARQLARVTVAGSGEILHQSAEPASNLREAVTSPGGTTAAALAILMAEPGGLRTLM